MRREASASVQAAQSETDVIATAAGSEPMPPATRKGSRRRLEPGVERRPALAVATAAYLAFVAWVTLGPQPYDPSTAGLLDRVLALLQRAPVTAWMTFDVVEFTANVALFVPLGVLLVLLLGARRWWLVLALALALTCGIESAQGAWLPTRVSDPRDVLANSAGATIGIALALALALAGRRPVRRRKDRQ